MNISNVLCWNNLNVWLKEESVTSTCSPPPSQIEINAADGTFTEVGTITTTSGFASVSSTSTFVPLESSTLSNGPSSF